MWRKICIFAIINSKFRNSTDAIYFFNNLLLDKILQKDVASERLNARSAVNTTQADRRSVVDGGAPAL